MALKSKARNYAKKAIRGGKNFARKVGKNIRKRYSGKSAIPNLLKDVTMLKHLVNIEKKRSDITLSTATAFAQTFGASTSGAYAAIISPTILEGVTQGQRIGLSVKCVSACLDIQFVQQSSTVNNLKCKWWIVCKPDNGPSTAASTAIANFFEPNPISGVVDFYSSRDPEYFTSFKVIRSGVVTLSSDSITGASAVIQKKFPLKLNHHLKYNTDASTTTTKNQFYLFVTCSGGDLSAATGGTIQYNMRWYYTDN